MIDNPGARTVHTCSTLMCYIHMGHPAVPFHRSIAGSAMAEPEFWLVFFGDNYVYSHFLVSSPLLVLLGQ